MNVKHPTNRSRPTTRTPAAAQPSLSKRQQVRVRRENAAAAGAGSLAPKRRKPFTL